MTGKRATALRGRPPISSVAHLEAVAVELFDRDGYQATTIQDVARAAGVSRSTVFRYVNNKIQLLWLFVGDYEGEIVAGLAEEPQDRSVFQIVEDAMVRTSGTQRDDDALLRRKLRIIAANAEQLQALQTWTAQIASLIVEFLAEHMPEHAPSAWLRGVAHSYTVTTGVALMQWGGAEPGETATLPETVAASLAPLTAAYEQAFVPQVQR